MSTIQLLTTPGHEYIRYAFVAAIAVGLVCSLLSVIIVLKRMAFIGQGISHAGFGGVGTAALLGFTGMAYQWQQDIIVLIFCLASAVAIGLLSRSRIVARDSAIGILLVVSMAWGVLAQNIRMMLLESSPTYLNWVGGVAYGPNWESIMFGSLLHVGQQGMWTAVVLCIVIISLCALLYKEMLFFTFDETVSKVFGTPSAFLHYLLLLMLALVVVVTIRLVGLILVSALLIVPGTAALMLSRRMMWVLILSAVIGVVGSVGGLVISLEMKDLSPGACIVALLFILFMVSLLISACRRCFKRKKV